ncbi:MAG: hypothetical protein LAO21_22985 [Acidobacteriia bacterium]|nr:hypothetical protein [Terriglobia bacterium]
MTTLYSYVVEHDRGDAPYPFGGYCTLVNCKYRKKGAKRKNVIELAEEDDWVVGTGGVNLRKSAGHKRLVYAMRVDKKMSLRQYSAARRFRGRKDNHHSRSEIVGRYALISKHFYYFGRSAPKLPKKFRDYPLEKKGPAFRNDFSQEFIESFMSWLKQTYRMGIHGKPCMPNHFFDSRCGANACG